MIRHFCYSDHRMTMAADKCVTSALRHGCNSSVQFGPSHISKEFYNKNKSILDQDRGAGYWLWKPYFMLKMLEEAERGDIVVYTDAGVELIADINYLIEAMDQEVMLFGNGHIHGHWCKWFVLGGMGCEDYIYCEQVQASCVIIQASSETINFVKEWMFYCELPGFIDDSHCEGNHPHFKEHRHDQAILTNMAYLYGLKLHKWPAQYALNMQKEKPDKYPQVFNHHGLRNNGKRV